MIENRKCKVKDCGRKYNARGFCKRHYDMWRNKTLDEQASDPLEIHEVDDPMVLLWQANARLERQAVKLSKKVHDLQELFTLEYQVVIDNLAPVYTDDPQVVKELVKVFKERVTVTKGGEPLG